MKSTVPLLFIMAAAIAITGCQSPKPKPISKEVAAVKITEFANLELQKRTYISQGMYLREENGIRRYPRLTPNYWHTITNVNDRWLATHFAREGVYRSVDDGLLIRASVDQFGLKPRIEECQWLAP